MAPIPRCFQLLKLLISSAQCVKRRKGLQLLSGSGLRKEAETGLSMAVGGAQSLHHGCCRKPGNLHHLVPGSMPANELQLIPTTFQTLCQQTDQCFIGGRIHRGRGDFDPKFASQRFTNSIRGCAGLQFD